MVAISGGVYYYYTTTQSTIAQLIEDKTTLQNNFDTLSDANDVNIQTIDDLQIEYQRVQDDFSELQADFQQIRQENGQLRERLGRHDLGALAYARPGLVENIINNATKEAGRCFELLSGAPLNDDERNSTNGNEFNSECPWLFDELGVP